MFERSDDTCGMAINGRPGRYVLVERIAEPRLEFECVMGHLILGSIVCAEIQSLISGHDQVVSAGSPIWIG